MLFAAVGVYPILAQRYGLPAPAWLMAKQLKLGLDLKGGVHLVMRVNRDDALRISTETAGEQLREALQAAGVSVGSINVTSPTTLPGRGRAAGQGCRVPPHRGGADSRRTTTAASGVGGAYDFTMRPNIVRSLREQTMVQAHDTIDRRVNELGVTEPNIATHGDAGDQLLVQMPGVSDVARAKDIIGSPALLEIKLVEGGPASSREELLQSHGGQVPSDMEVVSGASDRSNAGDAATSYYLVRKVATVSGSDLRSASVGLDENSRPAVMFSLKPDGARKFGQVTGSNVGRYLAVVLDDRVQSYARIESRISSDGRIAGGFTQQEAADLALKLRSGALPASMTYLEERVVGPTLGADSIRSGVTASLAGLVLVVIFMLAYYKLSGINAIVAMIVNLIILLGMMAYIDAAMTLPGIAGFILTMGMGVDSNVLIFERIKEELAANRGARAAVAASFDRVFWTLFDTHVTSLIAAAFLFQFGTGPIRGFATTLFVGLVSNLFTSIFVSRTLFEFVLSRRPANAQTVSI